jgi:hypothetical protein
MFEPAGLGTRMVECVLLQTRGLSHELGQDHRHHHNRAPQHPVLRPFFRLAERLLFRCAALVSLLVCLCISTPLAVFAQQTVDDDDVIRVSTDLLLFPVRIRNKKGQAVAGLTDQDLLLKDQDQVTTGLYFSPGADRVALMFALDQSGSLRQVISQQRKQRWRSSLALANVRASRFFAFLTLLHSSPHSRKISAAARSPSGLPRAK